MTDLLLDSSSSAGMRMGAMRTAQQAISPRLAISIFLNMGRGNLSVMAGPVPAIHDSVAKPGHEGLGGLHGPGHSGMLSCFFHGF
ncbi:MAG TPA: hypothetical protein VND95_08360, partial [Stellaceae bacterium]|nr:hypothetical protein [Stellaceae bacterium]